MDQVSRYGLLPMLGSLTSNGYLSLGVIPGGTRLTYSIILCCCGFFDLFRRSPKHWIPLDIQIDGPIGWSWCVYLIMNPINPF